MKKLISSLLLVVLSGCALFHPAPQTSQVQPQKPVSLASTRPFEFPYKSDLPPTHVVRQNAELWEFVQPGYYVPLATMRNNDIATSLLRDASTEKSTGTVQQLILGGTAYYRALLGPFKTKAIAQKEARAFSRKHLVDETPAVEYIAG